MAGHRTEHVSNQTLRVDSYEYVLASANVALDQSKVRLVSKNALEADDPEVSVLRRDDALADPANKTLRL